MKTKTILTLATVVAATTFLASCGKYEDGPGISLLTKKARLTGEWDAVEYETSNGIVTADNSSSTVEFDKSGTVTFKEDGFSITGTWEFSSDKEKIVIKTEFFGVPDTEELTILRLTNKEFWAKDVDGDITRSEKI